MAAVDAVRAGYGVALLAAPGAVSRAPVDARAAAIARVLGGRHLAQAAVLAAHPSPRWRAAGALVDALHGASMIAVARAAPRYRRLAIDQAWTAAAFAAAQLIDARR